MAGLRDLRRRLKSVQNTKKITYAMKLVSAAKLRRAQESVSRSREYTNAISELLNSLCQEQGGSEFSHPLLETRDSIRSLRLVVVGGSRGLCGAYNSNINKKVEEFWRQKQSAHPGVSIEAYLLGRKPAEYFKRTRKKYVKSFEVLPEDANLWPIQEICLDLETDYLSGHCDEVYILYTKFKSAISMSVQCEKIIPLETSAVTSAKEEGGYGGLGRTLFEPSPREVFEAVIPRILRSKLRQGCLDAKASEHGSRMTAMDAATKNSTDLLYSMQLTINKLRQSGITGQLLDIVGGAEALNG